MKTNAELRSQARTALKGNMGPAILVALLASLPSLIAQVAASNLNLPMQQVLNRYIIQMYVGGTFDPQAMLLELARSISSGTYIALGLSLLSFLLLPFLNLGFIHYCMKLLKGEYAEVSDVLSRRGIFGKAIGQTLLRVLKILLWSLLGLAVMIGLELLGVLTKSATVVSAAAFLGMGVYLYLVVRAILSYYMSEFILADRPETGAMASIRESIAMMKPERGRLMVLLMFFVLLDIVIAFACSYVEMLSVMVGTTLSMALQLVVNVYATTTLAAYYLTRRGERIHRPAESEELN